MARYEFVEGTSSKFWDIVLTGSSFTTTYGKLGTPGQATTKSFASDAEAKKEHDKLVAEKLKKGYVASGAAAAPTQALAVQAEAEPDEDEDEDDDEDEKPTAKSTGGRYFEFVEGSSSKFWEITLVGTEVRTRYGKIGAAGQTTHKDLRTAAAAQKEHDKLIAEKTKKGYEEQGGDGADDEGDDDDEAEGPRGQDGPDRRNPELEAAIAADPGDDAALQVYADWLAGQGDPRGELIALQLKNPAGPAARALLEKYEKYFLGDLHAHQQTHDGNEKPAFVWKGGYIHAAHLSYNSYADEDFEGRFSDVLTTLLTHPSGRFLAELTLTFNGEPNDGLGDLIDALVAHPPRALRKLHIGDFEIRGEDTELSWYDVGDLSRVWALVPRLETLIIQGGSFTLGTLDLPALRRADFITGGLSKASVRAIATARWPRIQALNIWFGDDNYGGDSTITDAQPLLARTDMRALRHLGLMNCGYTDELAAALPTSAILPQLASLSFAKGVLSDDGARGMAAHKDAFAHLDTLDVSECLLTDAGVRVLKGCAQKVISTEQRDIEDDPQDRYPAIGE